MGAHLNIDGSNAEDDRKVTNLKPIPDSSQNINGLQAESRKIGAHSRRKKVAKFVCSECGNEFTTRFRPKSKHIENIELSISEKFVFPAHINRYHTPKELQVQYKCEKCSYSTTFSTDLVRHMRSCRGKWGVGISAVMICSYTSVRFCSKNAGNRDTKWKNVIEWRSWNSEYHPTGLTFIYPV